MKRIIRFAIFYDGQLLYRCRMSEVLELLTSWNLGVDDVQLFVSGGVMIVDCD